MDGAGRGAFEAGFRFLRLEINFAFEDFAVEADVGVEEGARGVHLEDMGAVEVVEEDVGFAVSDEGAEAVGAEDAFFFGVEDAEVECCGIGEAVGEEGD